MCNDSPPLRQAALARALDIAPSTVTRDKRRGMPTYSVEAAQAWRASHVRPRLPAAPASDDGAAFFAARARREAAEAALAELRLARERAELVSAADAARAWRDFEQRAAAELQAFRERALLALQAAEPAAADFERVLREHVVEVLQRLSGVDG